MLITLAALAAFYLPMPHQPPPPPGHGVEFPGCHSSACTGHGPARAR
jgi:hypothetical protein